MADGTLTICTETDEKGIKVGMRDIEASVKRMSSSVEGLGEKAKIALQKQLDSLSKLNNQYGQQEQKVEALKKRLKELSDQKIETEEYKRLGAEIKKLDNEFEKVEQKQKEWLDMGFPADSMKNLDDQMDEIWEKMDKLQKKQAEMKSAGTAYVDPRSLSEYQSTASRLTLEEQRLDDMNNRLNTSFAATEMRLKECGEEAARSSSKFTGLAESAQRFAEKLKQSGIAGMKRKLHELWQALDKLMSKFMQLASGAIVGGLQKISGGIFAIHKSANKSTLSLKNLLKYAFGIRSLFVLFNKLRGAIGEGIQNLAKYDLATQTGNVNTCLSELQSALTQLKNSFATAFAPILTVVSPILVNFINLISQAVTRVGMLIAALTGQKTFVKAIAVQENYAASLDKTAKSAKKAAKALQGYLSPIDEINRYDDGKDNSNTGSTGKYTGPSPKDMFEEVPIESSLKGIAYKIKELIQNEDWEGLGAYIADGINKGLQKIYDVINWDNVGPKVAKFITAFTTTFNSLVDHINWDLMGRTLGAGVNTLVNSLNLLIGNGGIDFNKIGSSIAKGLRGAIREINWTSLGELLGNKFMISWRMLSGFVNEMSRKNDAGITGWTELGKAVGKAMTGTFSKISFTDIAKALVGVINGAFETLAAFDNEFDWKSFQENLKSGIQTMVNDIDWKGNGKAFGEFLSHLCTALKDTLTKDTFYEFGQGVGTFLGELPWGEILTTAAGLIIGGLSSAFSGMVNGIKENHPLAGAIVDILGKAFGVIKILQISGIGSLVEAIIGYIGQKIIAEKNAELIAEKLADVIGDGTRAASEAIKGVGDAAETASTGGLTTFASTLGKIFATAGIVYVATDLSVKLAKGIAGVTEAAQGGNGILSQTGGYLHDFAGEMENAHKITQDQAEELWKLIEADESAGKSNSDMYDSFIQKLKEYGISADKAKQILELYGAQAGVSAGFVEDMTAKVQVLGTGFSESAGQIDTSSITAKDAIKGLKDTLYELSLKSDDFGGTYQNVRDQLEYTQGSVTTAQEAFDIVYNALKDAGVPLDELNTALAETFPEAMITAKSSTESSMTDIETSVKTGAGAASTAVANAVSSIQKNTQMGMGAASAAAGAAMAGIQKSTEDSMSAAKKSVKDSTSDISRTSDQNWSTAEGFATGAMENVGQYTYDKMKEVYGVVSRYNSSIEDDFNQKWGNSQNTVVQAIQNMASRVAENCSIMASGVENAFSSIPDYISRIMNNAVGRVNNTVSNINSTIDNIERGFTFSYNVQLPNGGRRWGNYSLNLPRVNTVPYLATGAVIPPRSEFLAVLGDQKNGRNLEAPESLIRQIVREETGGSQGNNTYNVSVSASGRKLLDIVLEEGELRRNRNGGKNPFKLDD